MANESESTPLERLAGFQILECIEKGERGAVYRAREERTPRVVALKIVRVEDEAARRAWMQAMRAAAAFSHPNVATTYAVGEDAGRVYVVRELVEGRAIDVAARDAPEARVRWLADVAHALWAAHRRGIGHGSVGARNVLVDRDGVARLTDFGARTPDATASDDQRAWGALGAALFDPDDALQAIFRRAQSDHARERFASMDAAAAAIEPPPASGTSGQVAMARTPLDAAAALPNETTAPAQRRVDAGRAARWGGVGLLAVVIAAGAWVSAQRGVARNAAQTQAAAPASSSTLAYRIGDGGSTDARARMLLAAGMQAARDAAFTQARRQLDEAVRIDPTFASARLRRVLLAVDFDEDAREHFARAFDFRMQLDSHERLLLDAFEPCMRTPPDPREAVSRMQKAVAANPNDADLLIHYGRVLWLASDFRGSMARMDEALRIDPTLAAAIYYKALAKLDLGDETTADDLQTCIATSPAATTCLNELAMLDERRGQCEAAEALMRRLIAIEPSSAAAYYGLLLALDGEGKSPEAVQIAVSEYLQRLPSPEREREAFAMRAHQALADGDFVDAERTLRAWEKSLVGEPDVNAQMPPIDERLELYLETGRRAEAAALAKETLARMSAWTTSAYEGDTSLLLYVTLYRAGAIDRAELQRRRARWLAEQRKHVQLADELRRGEWWDLAYASVLASRDDAEEGLRALDDLPPMVSALARDPTDSDRTLGTAYLLTGQAGKALSFLRAALASCQRLETPMQYGRAQLAYGEALEATGDLSGACEAYANVLARWGTSKPPSITATAARKRSALLRCPRVAR